jgi:hypothetical protein
VYDAIAVAEDLGVQPLQELLSPRWVRRRDLALTNLRKAIRSLRSVLRDVPANLPFDYDRADVLLAPIERELRRLAEPWEETDERGASSPPLLLLARSDLWGSVGRPFARKRAYVEEALRKAQVPRRNVRALLRAAGLAEPTPHRGARNPR